mmetsp:Transcript_134296/g.237600  ORF Transcript_134296/g.237600 Transcript_134296/m.237600 type:complete len:214 (-) Transcript_134296:40-681(-)
MAVVRSVTFWRPTAVACCLMMFGNSVRVAGQASAVDVSEIVREAAQTMRIAKFATLATMAADGTISARMVYPKPPNATLGESPDLHFVRFATLSHSRKFKEIQAHPQATLVYYDDAGKGEVTLKGVVSVCNSSEATQGWYDRWKSNYPQGPATPFYTLLRLEATSIEFVSYVRYSVDEGKKRSDWRPLTLWRRSPDSGWQYSPPPPDPAEMIA